jgi:nucleoside-diphosphate-sugar epimerase
MAAKGLRFYTPGTNGFVDVRDVAEALLLLVEKNIFGHRFLAIGENIPFRTYYQLAAQKLGKKPPHIPVPEIPAKIAASVFDGFRALGVPLSRLTRKSVDAAFDRQSYNASALKSALAFKFRSIDQALTYTSEVYKWEQEQKKDKSIKVPFA